MDDNVIWVEYDPDVTRFRNQKRVMTWHGRIIVAARFMPLVERPVTVEAVRVF